MTHKEGHVKITVDGIDYEVDPAHNLLEALLALGEDLPYFCWHPELGSVGACRQCAVVQYMNPDDERGRIVMSCMTPVMEGALFSVQREQATNFRTSVIENLMVNHPHDCPVCEEGGECHLQDMTVMTGHRDRKYRHLKTTFENQYLGPFIGHEMNRCITCYRCVRYYDDYAGGDDLAAFASRDRIFFGRAEDGMLENEFAGNLVEVCPTGVFTDKTLSEHYTRKWDLSSSAAICQGCSLGCNISVSERYGELRRIHNRYHSEINRYFLCDRGRFGGQYVNSKDRIPHCGTKVQGNVFSPVAADIALDEVAKLKQAATRVIGIGSGRASLEANYALRRLVGVENYYNGLDAREAEFAKLHLEALNSNLGVASLAQVEASDAVLILGEDLTNHAPRLALALRQASRNEAKAMADSARIPLWHDAAVRSLAQDSKSPVFILTPGPDRLDDIGESVRLSRSEIAAHGFALAHHVDSSFPAVSDVDDERISKIAAALADAQHPLIVAGSSLKDPEIVKAALNVASALKKTNDQTRLVLSHDESNTLAAVLLGDQNLPKQSADVVIVVENDLSRRMGSADFAAFLANTKHLVVIDHTDCATASAAEVVLPAATFAEAEGTYINNEGRAQRSFGAFKPARDIAPAWQWLNNIAAICDQQTFATVDDLLISCAAEVPTLAAICEAAPDAQYRDHGLKVSRMTHRASGRTAMRANISVHERQQPADDQSAMAYSMEGTNASAPSAVRPYTWAPGWNSNQSISKFQDEIGGPLRSGDPGVLLSSAVDKLPVYTPGQGSQTILDVVPGHHIFASDELTAQSPAMASAAPRASARLNEKTAASLGVKHGGGLKSGDVQGLEVVIDDSIADATVICLLNAETASLFQGEPNLTRDPDFSPALDVIASDRTRS